MFYFLKEFLDIMVDTKAPIVTLFQKAIDIPEDWKNLAGFCAQF